MGTEEPELIAAMRENELQHQELLWKYNELTQTRDIAAEIITDENNNVTVSRMQTETNHIRQRVWYIITALTLILFSKFAFQPINSVTSPTNTILLTTIIVLFLTVSVTGSGYKSSTATMLISVLISLIVILYISLYIIHR